MPEIRTLWSEAFWLEVQMLTVGVCCPVWDRSSGIVGKNNERKPLETAQRFRYLSSFPSTGDLVMNDHPCEESFDLLAQYYQLDKELLIAEREIFTSFKSRRDDIKCSTATDVLSTLYWFYAWICPGRSVTLRNTSDILLRRAVIQCFKTSQNIFTKHNGTRAAQSSGIRPN